MWDSNPQAIRNAKNMAEVLERFAIWQKDNLRDNFTDVAMLLTGRNFNSASGGDSAGKAYVGEACNTRYGVAVVEDRDASSSLSPASRFLSTANTIVHEIGHTLDMKHDFTVIDNMITPASCVTSDDKDHGLMSVGLVMTPDPCPFSPQINFSPTTFIC